MGDTVDDERLKERMAFQAPNLCCTIMHSVCFQTTNLEQKAAMNKLLFNLKSSKFKCIIFCVFSLSRRPFSTHFIYSLNFIQTLSALKGALPLLFKFAHLPHFYRN